MKRIIFAIFYFLVVFCTAASAQQPTYKLSMPNLTGFPDAIEEGETYDLSIKMFNTGSARFFVGDKVQMHIKVGSHPAENLGNEITLNNEIFPVSAGTGMLDSMVWEAPNYQFPLDKFGGGTNNDIIVWPTVMRAGNTLDPTPDSAYKSIFYITGAAFRVNNAYITGIAGTIQFGGAYLIEVRTENVGITNNIHDIVFYAQLDDDSQFKTEIVRLNENVSVGGIVGTSIQTFKPSVLFPSANLSAGQHYLHIFAIEDGLNNVVQKALYPIAAGTFPVTLTSFSGQAVYPENKVKLEWVTEHESENKEFILQKYNFTTSNFETLETVMGKGNNTGSTLYDLFDEKPYQGNNHYRLIQKDIDGTSQILETITVVYQINAMSLISLSPNPSEKEVIFHLFNGLSESIRIEIFDGKGVQLLLKRGEYPTGTLDISVDISHLPQGLYFYKIANVYNTYTGTLVKK